MSGSLDTNTLSGRAAQSQMIAGYIARQILKETYKSSNDYSLDFNSPARDLVIHLTTYLLDRHLQELIIVLRQERAYVRNHTRLLGILNGLQKFTLPLESALSPNVIDQIRGTIPDLTKPIESILRDPPSQPFSHLDAKALAIARWFKHEYMSWVDPILCPRCGGKTRGIGGDQPSHQELQDGAGRVELHKCEKVECGRVRRFARYNNVETLLRTKEGRCGEFAHLFYYFLLAAGLEARYVWNSEDHVWTEHWSPELKHWVHVDSCEGETNKPLLYARGWGKKQAFCFAIGPYGVEDVTRAYVDDYIGACQSRRRAFGWNERYIREVLLEATVNLRLRMSSSTQQRLEAIDIAQRTWIGDEAKRMAESRQTELGGRNSGPADWRAQRQELGLPVLEKPKYTVARAMTIPLSEYQTLGDARHTSSSGTTTDSTGGPRILLTDGSSQVSGVFHPMALKQDVDFHCKLTFRMTPAPGMAGADGMALVLSPERKLGLAGYGMGYTDLGGEGDFAIEIDVYRTQDHANDPPTPHISLHSPPDAHHRYSKACTAPSSIPEMSDGKINTLEVFYRAKDRRVTVFLRADEGKIELGLFEVNVPSGDRREWYLGVTGACGGLWQVQEVLALDLEQVVIS